MKHRPPQFEFNATTDAFNLAMETTVDGERVAREQALAAQVQTEARIIESQRQTILLPTATAPKPPTFAVGMQAAQALQEFIGRRQLSTMKQLCRGEEGQFFIEKLVQLADLVAKMPKTYEQQDLGDKAIVSLHYFAGGQANWWITEKDKGDPDEPGQLQAFGLADLFGDGGELGYISIVELLACNAELDLYFTPKTLAEVRQ